MHDPLTIHDMPAPDWARVDELARIHAASFTAPPPWDAATLTATLNDRFSFLLGEPGGFLIGRALAGEAELLTLAVDPAQRRRGIAGRLVAGFRRAAQLRGAEIAFLEVAEGNAAARALYAAAGFAEAGRRPAYYRQPDGLREDALLLACPIGTSG